MIVRCGDGNDYDRGGSYGDGGGGGDGGGYDDEDAGS